MCRGNLLTLNKTGMKNFQKKMLIAGGALVIGSTAVLNFLVAQPKEQLSDLTRVNIEAMSGIEEGLFTGTCAYLCEGRCYVTCPRCKQITYTWVNGCGTITGGYCSNCFYIP